MRLTTILATIIIASPAAMAADTALSRELEDIQKKRARELADSTEPINRKYQGILEQLRNRAIQAKDLETANKIQEAITANTPAPISTGFEGDWNIRAYGRDNPRRLMPDHTIVTEHGAEGTWKVTGSKLILMYRPGTHGDVFNLPIQDNKLFGTNGGEKLTMIRVR